MVDPSFAYVKFPVKTLFWTSSSDVCVKAVEYLLCFEEVH